MPVRRIKNKTISTKLSEIQSLINDSKAWATTEPRLAAHLATYIDVYLLGVIEESVELLLKQRAGKCNDPEVCNYINKDVEKRFRNPSRQTILEILGKFSDAYASSFGLSFPTSCREIDALQSILDHKTNLAHKGISQLGLTPLDAENYFGEIITVIEKLEQILS